MRIYVKVSRDLSYETGEDGEKLAKQFGEIIKVFEEQSDVLLIDQLNNPGGSAPYVYGLLSMLTDQPLEVPLHRLKLTQEDVCEAGTLIADLESTDDLKDWTDIFGETFDGLPLSETFRKGFIDACYFIIDQWNQGKLFTDFHPLYGLETVEPNPEVHYTKQIVVLINSLDFSGGDFFPAIMQDNKRAILLGTRTAGAGGCVDIVSFRNLSGIEEVSVTASFALRPNREPIENLGVTPDIVYNLSVIDLQEGYREYKKRILEELEKHGNTDF